MSSMGGEEFRNALVFMPIHWLIFGTIWANPLLRLPFLRWLGILGLALLFGSCGLKDT